MISPDIAVFLGIALTAHEQKMRRWDMRTRGRACPPVLLEVSSEGTWSTDIELGVQGKPHVFGQMGAREYVAYDPPEPRVWRGQGGRRLLGWRYDAAGRAEPLAPD